VTSYYVKKRKHIGWQCPLCGQVYAPSVQQCLNHKRIILTGEVGPFNFRWKHFDDTAEMNIGWREPPIQWSAQMWTWEGGVPHYHHSDFVDPVGAPRGYNRALQFCSVVRLTPASRSATNASISGCRGVSGKLRSE
jgi:hypothetical protein